MTKAHILLYLPCVIPAEASLMPPTADKTAIDLIGQKYCTSSKVLQMIFFFLGEVN